MRGARFRKSRNAADLQYPAHLREYLSLVRDMVERIEAKDPIDASVGQVDLVSVKMHEAMRRLIAEDRVPLGEMRSYLQRRGGDIEADHFKSHLVQHSRGPSGTGAEVDDTHSGIELQTLKQIRRLDEQVYCVVARCERFREKAIPVAKSGEVFFSGLIELFDGVLVDELPDVDERRFRAHRSLHESILCQAATDEMDCCLRPRGAACVRSNGR